MFSKENNHSYLRNFQDRMRAKNAQRKNEMIRSPQVEIKTFTISASEYKVWRALPVPQGLRAGQFFHQYFKLEKLTSEHSKYEANKIYEADGQRAASMILSHVDWEQ